MKKKLLIFLTIILILGVGGFFGYRFFYNKYFKKSPQNSTKTPDPTIDWEIYKSEGYKFSIKYPKDWEMTEKPNKDALLSSESITILSPLPEQDSTSGTNPEETDSNKAKPVKILVNVYEDEDFLLNWVENENKHYEMKFLEWKTYGKNNFAKVEIPEFKNSISFITAKQDIIYEINLREYPQNTNNKSFNEKLDKEIEFLLMNFKIID